MVPAIMMSMPPGMVFFIGLEVMIVHMTGTMMSVMMVPVMQVIAVLYPEIAGQNPFDRIVGLDIGAQQDQWE